MACRLSIINQTFRNKLQWNLNRNSYIFIQENPLQIVVWKLATILSRPPCVKLIRPPCNIKLVEVTIDLSIIFKSQFCCFDISKCWYRDSTKDFIDTYSETLSWRRHRKNCKHDVTVGHKTITLETMQIFHHLQTWILTYHEFQIEHYIILLYFIQCTNSQKKQISLLIIVLIIEVSRYLQNVIINLK